MTPQHITLQQIGCHGRVNIGNFSIDLIDQIDPLLDQGHISLSVCEGQSWVSLTSAGLDYLCDLNTGNKE
jgi:hypothetical protein